MSRRTLAFCLVVAVCVLGAGAFAAIAALSGGSDTATLPEGAAARADAAAPLPRRLRVLVRAVSTRDPRLNGRLYVVSPGRRARAAGGPACQRVAFAGGRGLCLYLASSGVDYRAAILDRELKTTKTLGLTGLPSRARVSPGGRYGAMTTFVSGDNYTEPGQFSTRTQIVELASGRVLGDLERFRFTLEGRPVNAVDRNFWGVTFAAGDDRFYATMATGGHRYLVQGSVSGRSGEVLRDGVECPSLSPDGTRIAYKSRVSAGRWRIHVYDLRTRADRAVNEPRSVDDQVAWLTPDRLGYGRDGGLWTVPADGSGRPTLLMARVDSPTVLER
jgi:dipeptidyl aminopeptidase/acylaminoacyl peptidase